MKKEDISFKMSDEKNDALKKFIMLKAETVGEVRDKKMNKKIYR